MTTLPPVIQRIESTFEPRGRRLLLIVVSVAVLIGGIAISATRGEGDAAPSQAAPKQLPTQAEIEAERFGAEITPPKEALVNARSFVNGAVLRTDLAAAWPLTTQALRGESMTRERWLEGTIPVNPYLKEDFGQARFNVVRHRERSILLLVLITPKKIGLAPQQDFYLELVPADGRWLVNYWAPKGRLEAPIPTAQ